jgi:hypothetical protein
MVSQVVDGAFYSPGFSVCPGSHWVGVTWNGLVSSTSWTVTPGIYYSGNTTICNFDFPSNGPSGISLVGRGSNTCGFYDATFYISKRGYGCGSFAATVSPNPSNSGDVSVKTSVTNGDGIQHDVVADVLELADEQNAKVVSLIPTESATKLDTKQLKNGTYYLRISFGGEIITKRLIIKK